MRDPHGVKTVECLECGCVYAAVDVGVQTSLFIFLGQVSEEGPLDYDSIF